MAKLDTLCDSCRSLNIVTLRAPGGVHHANTFAVLVDRAATCRLCRLIASNDRGELPSSTDRIMSSSVVRCYMTDNVSAPGLFTSVTAEIKQGNGTLYRHLKLFTQPNDSATRIGVPVRAPLSTTASRHSFQTARDWMSTCVNTHKCSEAVPFLVKQFQSGSWPSRLLDVETYSDDVRLVEMKDPTMVYAALSYCWGTNTNVHANYITTKDTLDASFKRIVYASLPRTLQDAITICRGLGIGYLWIDALCIIQDSPQDWQTEAVKMGIIYSQAVVTIAASLGDNCDSGCFNKRTNALEPQIPSDTVEVSSILTTGEVSNLCFYRDWRKEDFSFQHTAEIASSPLQTRGWTLQERILATRILHYGSNMLCWECRYCYADEQYLRSRYGKDDTIPSFTINHLEAHLGHRSLERQIITQWYRNIVEEYSRRALTYQTDKLPAISAVARLIHDHTGATYIAGLWTLNLQYGLFWKSVGPKVQHPVYVAPSFSWASCSNPVQWNEDPSVHMDEAEFTITGFGFEYEGNDLFGKLRSGWLGLKGHLLRAKVQPYNMPFHEFKRLAYRVNLREEDIVLPNALLFAETGEKCGHAYLDVVNPDEEVMCFLLKKSSGSDPLCSLVISPDSANGSRYERRGVAGLANNPWEDVFQASPAVDFIIG